MIHAHSMKTKFHRDWYKKVHNQKKLSNIKKVTIFTNLNFDQVSLRLGEKCGFFINGVVYGCVFFAPVSRYKIFSRIRTQNFGLTI